MTASLVVQTSFLGDMVLTTPLVARLAESGPVDVLSTPVAAPLLANNPAVREVIAYDKRGADRGVGGFLRMASLLRARGYGAAYLAQGSMRSGMLTAAARIPERVGFTTSAGRAFYTRRVPATDSLHHAARLLSLALGADERARVGELAGSAARTTPPRGGPATVLRPRLYPGPPERVAVDEILGTHAMGEPLIAFAPGSVWATKRWPHFAPLAYELRHAGQIVVVGSVADRPLAETIIAATKGQAIDTTGRLSLLASAELIGRAALIVTNDSAPLHLASAMNTPTIAVFGPTVPAFGFGPLADRSSVVGHTLLACRPCDRHGPQRCPLGHWRCMREIEAQDVAAIALERLSSRMS